MDRKAETSNAHRAKRAEQIVRHYSRVPRYRGQADYEADITDLMTDLRHFCARGGLDLDEIAERSRRHYTAERKQGSNRERTRKQGREPTCPNCRGRLEYEPDQDGACDWYCHRCGWHQHVSGDDEVAQARAHGGMSITVEPQMLDALKVDLRLLKHQAALLGKVVDKGPMTDDERSCLEGLWEFVHRIIDWVETSSEPEGTRCSILRKERR